MGKLMRQLMAMTGLFALAIVHTGCSGGGGDSNHAPQITGIAANPDTVQTGAESQITCTATDQDGDALTYQWSCGAGEIAGNDANATFTAPATPQVCTITCSVSDGKDKATATAQVNVTVEAPPNAAPVIDTLVAEPDTIEVNLWSDITCTAHDDDGDALTYQWGASAGEFDGATGGAEVVWHAPATAGTCTVTCTVSDGKAKATASAQVDIAVIEAGTEVLGDWWLMAFQNPGESSSEPFGPLDQYVDPYTGKHYEYIHITFNSDGTFLDRYKYCEDTEELDIGATWTYEAAENRWRVAFNQGGESIVEINGDMLVGYAPDGSIHWYERSENRYNCPAAPDDDPTGTWELEDLTFAYGDGHWTLSNATLVIDRTTGSIKLSGDGSDGHDYEYNGTYTRDGNSLTAVDMEEAYLGAEDTIDLNLTLDGDSISGDAYNTAGGDYGYTAVTGTRISHTVSVHRTSKSGEKTDSKLR